MTTGMGCGVYNALIRTHHITSRKKVALLKAAAKKLECYALLRSGGVPGVMFIEGCDATCVQKWVDVVRGLRYKDYHLVSGVSDAPLTSVTDISKLGSLEEISTIKSMSELMERKGLLSWWRMSMGYLKD